MGEGERSGEGETNEITATVNVPALASQNEPSIVLSSSFEVPAPSPVKKKKFRRRTFLMGLTKEPVIRKERTEKLKAFQKIRLSDSVSDNDDTPNYNLPPLDDNQYDSTTDVYAYGSDNDNDNDNEVATFMSTPLRPPSKLREQFSTRREIVIKSSNSDVDEPVAPILKIPDVHTIPKLHKITEIEDTNETFSPPKEDTSPKFQRKKADILVGEVPTCENEFVYDITNKDIFVRKALHTTFSRRSGEMQKKNTRYHNSLYACPFGCPGLKSSFSNHARSQMHKHEPEMVAINAAPKEEAQSLLDLLRYKSNHIHNRKVIEEGKGEILLARKQGKITIFDVKQYGPCPYCYQWLSIKFMTRHIPECKCLPDKQRKPRLGEVRVKSRLMSGHLKNNASDLLKKEVFSIMKCDKIGVTAQSDPLIIALGNDWMTRNIGNKVNRCYYTSQIMRLAARLKIFLNEDKEDPNDLINYIKPDQFPAVCKAVLRIAQQDDDNVEEFKAPSNAIKMKYDLKRLACIKLTQAIIAKNALQQKDAEDFVKLMDMSYTDNLAKVALFHKMLNIRKPLPDPVDIKVLSDYLNKQLLDFNTVEVSYEQYKRAIVLSQAKLISFNRRRCGEVQQILLSSYNKRIQGVDDVTEGLMGELTQAEKFMLDTHEVIEIRGKKGKPVPVIVPPSVKKLLSYIVRNREEVGVKSHNFYLFACDRSGVLRGYNSVQSVVQECPGIKYQERLTSTNLRKYFATLTQSFDLSEGQLRQVLDHLGHTLDIHKVHYRALSPSIERLSIAKMLMVCDLGLMSRYQGKTLDEIPLNEIVGVAEKHGMPREPSANDRELEPSSRENSPPIDDEFEYIPWEPELHEIDLEFDAVINVPRKKPVKTPIDQSKRNPPQKKGQRTYMTADDIQELEFLFKDYIEAGKTPTKTAIKDFLEKNKKSGGVLHRFTVEKIQKRLCNMVNTYPRSKRDPPK